MKRQGLSKMLQMLPLSTVVMILLTGTLSAGDRHHSCSNRTLKGSYGLFGDGTVVGVGPNVVIAIFTYDGSDRNGNLEDQWDRRSFHAHRHLHGGRKLQRY